MLRDYPQIEKQGYQSEHFGTIFVPETYLTAIPKIVSPEEFGEKLDNLPPTHEKLKTKMSSALNNIVGDVVERKVYNALKEFFLQNQDDVLGTWPVSSFIFMCSKFGRFLLFTFEHF